jgi:hypothetical protein
MSLTPAHGPTVRTPFARELDRVTLSVPVESDEGRLVPTGSTGTIVAVWPGDDAFEVEFTTPFEALATVEARQISEVCPARGLTH